MKFERGMQQPAVPNKKESKPTVHTETVAEAFNGFQIKTALSLLALELKKDKPNLTSPLNIKPEDIDVEHPRNNPSEVKAAAMALYAGQGYRERARALTDEAFGKDELGTDTEALREVLKRLYH